MTIERNRIKVFVSSTVYDFETQLTQVFAMLSALGYDVYMSKKGTIPIDSTLNSFVNCVDSVRDCDVFLSFIRPLLGSGIYKGDEKSITEKEIEEAVDYGMPRFVMADYRVEYAHKFLSMMDMSPEAIPTTIDKISEEGKKKLITKIPNNLIHPHSVRMYRVAMRRSIQPEINRTGNWVQPFQGAAEYRELDDIKIFIDAQFRDVARIKHLIDKFKAR